MRQLIPSPAGVMAPVSVMSHGHVGFQHPLGEELAALAQPAGVVGQEGVVDQVGHRLLAGDRLGLDALAAQVRSGGPAHAFRPILCSAVRGMDLAFGFSLRASITMRAASAGSSVTRNSRRSVGLILRSSATVRGEPLDQPAPVGAAEQDHREVLTLPVWIRVSASNSSSSVP